MLIPIFLTVMAVFAQTLFVPLNLVLLALLYWIISLQERYWPVVAFGLGLLFDLLIVQPLGLSAIVFLFISFFCWLYSRKWRINHPIFLFIFLFVCDLLSRVIWGLELSVFQAGLVGLLAAIWGFRKQRSDEPVRGKLRT